MLLIDVGKIAETEFLELGTPTPTYFVFIRFKVCITPKVALVEAWLELQYQDLIIIPENKVFRKNILLNQLTMGRKTSD